MMKKHNNCANLARNCAYDNVCMHNLLYRITSHRICSDKSLGDKPGNEANTIQSYYYVCYAYRFPQQRLVVGPQMATVSGSCVMEPQMATVSGSCVMEPQMATVSGSCVMEPQMATVSGSCVMEPQMATVSGSCVMGPQMAKVSRKRAPSIVFVVS